MATIATLLNVTESDTEKFIENTIALERRLLQVRKPRVHVIKDD